MDRGAWQAAVHVVEKSRTQSSNFTFISLIPSSTAVLLTISIFMVALCQFRKFLSQMYAGACQVIPLHLLKESCRFFL